MIGIKANNNVVADIRMRAVSYTHLDVYKRQGLFGMGFNFKKYLGIKR